MRKCTIRWDETRIYVESKSMREKELKDAFDADTRKRILSEIRAAVLGEYRRYGCFTVDGEKYEWELWNQFYIKVEGSERCFWSGDDEGYVRMNLKNVKPEWLEAFFDYYGTDVYEIESEVEDELFDCGPDTWV